MDLDLIACVHRSEQAARQRMASFGGDTEILGGAAIGLNTTTDMRGFVPEERHHGQ
ncbi:MAG: hypothetical protein H6739_39640 [Alphaproteobacteria bacterium]|nr:hypothetical protein [Alphaproteobacteria bacterium]